MGLRERGHVYKRCDAVASPRDQADMDKTIMYAARCIDQPAFIHGRRSGRVFTPRIVILLHPFLVIRVDEPGPAHDILLCCQGDAGKLLPFGVCLENGRIGANQDGCGACVLKDCPVQVLRTLQRLFRAFFLRDIVKDPLYACDPALWIVIKMTAGRDGNDIPTPVAESYLIVLHRAILPDHVKESPTILGVGIKRLRNIQPDDALAGIKSKEPVP
ncbi:MAG: hypothetical protein A4E40_00855 [Methanoregulaceae archaeon PtaU1.Bin059]|nr:MAG: hypothetical protein A4E40_00855 [Methanoregulaceae archaeon PtaU1.Bin059]